MARVSVVRANELEQTRQLIGIGSNNSVSNLARIRYANKSGLWHQSTGSERGSIGEWLVVIGKISLASSQSLIDPVHALKAWRFLLPRAPFPFLASASLPLTPLTLSLRANPGKSSRQDLHLPPPPWPTLSHRGTSQLLGRVVES